MTATPQIKRAREVGLERGVDRLESGRGLIAAITRTSWETAEGVAGWGMRVDFGSGEELSGEREGDA